MYEQSNVFYMMCCSRCMLKFIAHFISSSCTFKKQNFPLLVRWVGHPTTPTVQNIFVSFSMWPKVITTKQYLLKMFQGFFEFVEGELQTSKSISLWVWSKFHLTSENVLHDITQRCASLLWTLALQPWDAKGSI